MRTREEILNQNLGPQGRVIDTLEVLIDIRDELVAQGKPPEVIAEQGPDYKAVAFDLTKKIEELDAELAWYRKAENGFAEVAKAVGLISETGSRIFEITECVRRVKDHVANSDAYDALRTRLSDYLGSRGISNDRIVELVRELGSLAQDRKAEIDMRQAKVDALEGVCRDLRADREALKSGLVAVTERERVLLQRVTELEHEVNAHAIRGSQP